MPTISTALKMLDQFASPLRHVTSQEDKAVASMDRLRSYAEAPATLRLNTGGAQKQIAGPHTVRMKV